MLYDRILDVMFVCLAIKEEMVTGSKTIVILNEIYITSMEVLADLNYQTLGCIKSKTQLG